MKRRQKPTTTHGDESSGFSSAEDSGRLYGARNERVEDRRYREHEEMSYEEEGEEQQSETELNERRKEEEEEELKMMEKVRDRLKKLPLKKLETVRKEGVDGVPLHKVLGLSTSKFVSAWLAGNRDNEESARKQSISSQITKAEGAAQSSSAGGVTEKRKKNAPFEMSSKNRVGRFRQVVATQSRKFRDPRFGPLSGTFSQEVFEKRYGFIDEIQDAEITELKDSLTMDEKIRMKKEQLGSKYRTKKKLLSEDQRAEKQRKLTQLQQARATKKRDVISREVNRKVKREEKDKVSKGIKKPYFLKQRDIKDMETRAFKRAKRNAKSRTRKRK